MQTTKPKRKLLAFIISSVVNFLHFLHH